MNTYINPEAIENKSITKDKLSDDLIFDIKGEIPKNEIWYTSNNDSIVTPYATDVFGANIISNTYENGKGIIKFDSDVTSIGHSAFDSCTSLTSVTIPDSVTSIEGYAFSGCSSLTSVMIPNRVTSIGTDAFSGCGSLTNIIIPDSVTLIGTDAFSGCGSLTSVTLGKGVTSIEDFAFLSCPSLTNITIPDSVASIGYEAFSDCTSLTSVTIPDSVTSIRERAFYNCTSLMNINIKNHIPESIESMVFDNISENFKIYIPIGALQSYISATNWSNYADHMYECIFEDENLISGQNIKTINGESILGNDDIVISIKEYTYSQLIELKNSNGLNPGAKYKLLDYVSDSSLCPILTALTSNSFDRKATAVDKNGDSYDIEFNIDKISGNLNTDKDNTGIILTLDRSPYENHDENVFIKSNGEGSEYDKKGLVITPVIPDEMSSIKSGEYYKFNVDQMYVYDANDPVGGFSPFNFDTHSFSYPYITNAGDQLRMHIYKDNVNENLIVELYSDDKLIKEYSTVDIYEFGQYVSFDNFLDIEGIVLRVMIDEVDDGAEIIYNFEYAIEYDDTIIIQDLHEQSLENDDFGDSYHDFYLPNSMRVDGVDDGNPAPEGYPVYICSKTPLITSNLKTYNHEFILCTKNTYMNADTEEISYYVPIYKGINPEYDEGSDVTYINEFNKVPEVGISNTISKITLISDDSLNGTITRMKDKNGNNAPIDFKNISIDGLSVFSDLQNSYGNQVECILEDDNVENYPYIMFTNGVKNNKVSTGTSNIRIGSSYNFVGTGVSNQNIYEDGMTILNRLTYIE